jgi:hypothetical protein
MAAAWVETLPIQKSHHFSSPPYASGTRFHPPPRYAQRLIDPSFPSPANDTGRSICLTLGAEAFLGRPANPFFF